MRWLSAPEGEVEAAERLDAIRSAMASAGSAWEEPAPRVGATGRRPERGRRRVRWPRVREAVRMFAQAYVFLALMFFVVFAVGFVIVRLVAAFT